MNKKMNLWGNEVADGIKDEMNEVTKSTKKFLSSYDVVMNNKNLSTDERFAMVNMLMTFGEMSSNYVELLKLTGEAFSSLYDMANGMGIDLDDTDKKGVMA